MAISKQWLLGVMMVAFTLSSVASADTQSASYGDFSGDTVDYSNVEELDVSNQTINTLFFGSPSVTGDNLVFDTEGFVSLAPAGGDTFAFLDGRLSFDVTTSDGSVFDSIKISEGGAYNVLGNGSASAKIVAFVATMDGLFEETFEFEQSSPGSGDWSGSVTVNFPETDFAVVSFDNQLLTQAFQVPGPPNDFAFIDKKLVVVEVNPSIPEPGSASLLIALVGLAATRRNRR